MFSPGYPGGKNSVQHVRYLLVFGDETFFFTVSSVAKWPYGRLKTRKLPNGFVAC